jgi:hypothetical protein
LYDNLEDKPVYCYLTEGQEELMRGAWRQRAFVVGKVTRDPLTGRPVNIRHITAAEVLRDVPPGSYVHARGIIPFDPKGPSPEEIIRRFRDARSGDRD